MTGPLAARVCAVAGAASNVHTARTAASRLRTAGAARPLIGRTSLFAAPTMAQAGRPRLALLDS